VLAVLPAKSDRLNPGKTAMNLDIAGKRALVLGASKGLGRAIAEGLAREGVNVVAAARNTEAITAWAAELGEAGSRVTAASLDLSDFASVERLIAQITASGGVDILINNSGGPPPSSALDAKRADWLVQFEAMAANLFHITQALLPAMVDKRWGRIVTIASSGIEQPIPNLALSNGIRSAVLGWSKTLATEVAKHGITVNMVLPGRIQTERVEQLDNANASRSGQPLDAVKEAARAAIPMGRYGTAQEFASVAVFLASGPASYVTGATIRIDGGAIRSV
jgi:3-oxoacyl-[acyl-carrier protein] reductase